MLDRLKIIKQKYQDLQKLLLNEQNINQKIDILKNLSKLEPTVELFNRYLNLETEFTQIQAILETQQDQELLLLAHQEKDTILSKKKLP
ncbi:protein chain release factor A ['Chrysanthemum coronarium' phytoplasma]|uniref:Protein chain release factor A n=1 Tax='Chrysanthemum coronarium' phytoplasma TaxID=1520703 RepID=A0ABQ0J1W6_9MOLU|nr:protein chain release factor A ['Chrysanthemum coronarium' phytoplasma]